MQESLNKINKADLIIVGSGFFGSTIAERTACLLNKKVVIIDKRDHIGGNAYSYTDKSTGINVHKYGSHIFHTSNSEVWSYVNEFAKFNSYKHKVFTLYKNEFYPVPINLMTLSSFFNKPFSPKMAETFFNENPKVHEKSNLENKAISLVGKELYEAFYKEYTQKQWHTEPANLPAEIIQRIPVRKTFSDNYFNDHFQGIPIGGYQKLFENMLRHPNITTILNTDFFEIKNSLRPTIPIVYTGPVDQYFDYKHGKLGWRSVYFEIEKLNLQDFQGTTVINYAEKKFPYTRIHEFKHFHPENTAQLDLEQTIIMKEYPSEVNENNDPYYPINTELDRAKLLNYRKMVDDEEGKKIFIGGRLGSYKYLDMHMAIASALNLFKNKISGILK
jgi:UDP-galactopyranose mutase